jgi:glutamate synthase (NADPH/NADH) large chain
MASEVGVVDIDPSTVIEKGRLQPGRMFLIDFEAGRMIPDEELKESIAGRAPYDSWIKDQKIWSGKFVIRWVQWATMHHWL